MKQKPVTSWPTCVNQLEPFGNGQQQGLPEVLRKTLLAHGFRTDAEVFMPVQALSLLGRCSTALYFDCPNVPEHHTDNASTDDDYWESVGCYYWSDFNAVAPNGISLPLRMVFNEGDADCNDGLWGAVWQRNGARLVANISSWGDCGTSIKQVSSQWTRWFENQEFPVLDCFAKADNEETLLPTAQTSAKRTLEQIIALAIRITGEYR